MLYIYQRLYFVKNIHTQNANQQVFYSNRNERLCEKE